jgi:DeoR/GlpR family transcriptional regulator of sugar metabolism
MEKMIQQKDLAPERQERLRDIVRDNGVVRVDELCLQLGVSPATVRRDLETLEAQGRVRRVHGGAVSIESRLEEPLFDDKTEMASLQKRGIAEKAATLVQPGETIYLDGGSTILELARILRSRSDITVVTNSLRATVELSGSGPQVILIGGELRRRSQTMVGSLTRLMLSQIHVDKAFMGTIGLSASEGTTTTDPNEAFTKELVMQQATEVILLSDSSKAGKVSFATAGKLNDIDTLIIDNNVDDNFTTALKKKGVSVVLV